MHVLARAGEIRRDQLSPPDVPAGTTRLPSAAFLRHVIPRNVGPWAPCMLQLPEKRVHGRVRVHACVRYIKQYSIAIRITTFLLL